MAEPVSLSDCIQLCALSRSRIHRLDGDYLQFIDRWPRSPVTDSLATVARSSRTTVRQSSGPRRGQTTLTRFRPSSFA